MSTRHICKFFGATGYRKGKKSSLGQLRYCSSIDLRYDEEPFCRYCGKEHVKAASIKCDNSAYYHHVWEARKVEHKAIQSTEEVSDQEHVENDNMNKEENVFICRFCGAISTLCFDKDQSEYVCHECEESHLSEESIGKNTTNGDYNDEKYIIGPDYITDDPEGLVINGSLIRKLKGELKLPEFQTVEKKISDGNAELIAVLPNVNSSLIVLGYVKWANGEKEVKVIACFGGPGLHYLVTGRGGSGGRLRMPIYEYIRGMSYTILNQARIVPDSKIGKLKMCKAIKQDLDRGIDGDIYNIFEKAGAISVGTRRDILNDDGRNRFELCVVFERDNRTVPIVSFLITRILPVLNEVFDI